MRYEDFKRYISENITRYLPEEQSDTEVIVLKQHINNGVLVDALGFSKQEKGTLIFNLESMFGAYENGEPLEKIMKEVVNVCVRFREQEDIYSLQRPGYEDLKDQLYVCARNAEMNQELLPRIPHEVKEDVALMYRARIKLPDGKDGTMLVHHNHLKEWGISEAELKEQAWNNMHLKYRPALMDMEELMKRILGFDGLSFGEFSGMMYVLSNPERHDGAAYIFDEEIMKEAGEILGTDYFVLPSSIHETFLVRKLEGVGFQYDLEGMCELVRSMNQTEIFPEEILSDEVYQYSRKNNHLTRVMVDEMKQDMLMTM